MPLHQYMLPFIILARLVEIGIEELARNIDDRLDRPADRRAVDVHVKHAHENRHANERLIAKAVYPRHFARRRHALDQGDEAIGRCNDRAFILRHGADGIAEKGENPDRHHQHQPADNVPANQKQHCGDRRSDQAELHAFGVDRWPAPFDIAASGDRDFVIFHGLVLGRD